MIAQMASTAGSIAIGSVVGHGISNMLFGGGAAPAPTESQAPPVQQQTPVQQQSSACGFEAKGICPHIDHPFNSSSDPP